MDTAPDRRTQAPAVVHAWIRRRRRRSADDPSAGGLLVLLVALAVPIQAALGNPRSSTVIEVGALVVFGGLFVVSQVLDTHSQPLIRFPVAIAMTVVSLWGLAVSDSEWVVAVAMTAAACANLLPLVVVSSVGVVVVALGAAAVTGNGGAGLVVAAAGAIAVLRGRLVQEIARTRAQRRSLAVAAVADERLRIAQDLHDVLGHSLVTMVVKAEVAERLVRSDPEAAAAAARDVQQVGREAMGEVHAAVTGVRATSVQTEVTRAAEALAPDVEFSAEIVDRAWSDDVEEVLAWVAREATTNVLRHSTAAWCRCVVTVGDGVVRMTVSNDGVGRRVDTVRGGNGLRGLTERVSALDGTLHAAVSTPGVFTLDVAVPTDGRRHQEEMR